MSDEARRELLDLFTSGYGPGEARALRRESLMLATPAEKLHLVLSNKALLPDIYQTTR
jgi:hypothetical protein